MAYAWKRSAKALCVTTGTTFVAFAANAFSPIMPIKAFGIYAAIVIFSSFLTMCIMIPPILVLHEKYIAKRFACLFPCCSKKKDDGTKAKSRLEIFFGGFWSNLVHDYKSMILALFGIWTVVAIAFAA